MPKQPKVKSNDPNRIDTRKKRSSAFSSVAEGGTVETGMEFAPENPNLVQNNTGMDTLQVGKTYNPIGQVAAGTELANLLNAGMGAATAAAKGYGYVKEKEEKEQAEQEAEFEALQKSLEQNKIDKARDDQKHDEELELEFRSRVLELNKRISDNPSEYNATRRHEEMQKIYDMYPDTGFRTKEGRIGFEENRIEHGFKRGEAYSADWYYENVDQQIARIQASSLPEAEKASLIMGVVDRAIEAAEGDPELLKDFPKVKSNLQARLGGTWDTAHARAEREAKTLVQAMGPKLADAYTMWVSSVEGNEDPLQDYVGEDDPIGALMDDLMEAAGIDIAMLPSENAVRNKAREIMLPKIQQLREQVIKMNKEAVKTRLVNEANYDIVEMQDPAYSLERSTLDQFSAFSGTIAQLRNSGDRTQANQQFERGLDQILFLASERTIDFGGTSPEDRQNHMHATFQNMLSEIGIVVSTNPETGKIDLENSGLPKEDIIMIKSIENKIQATDFDVIGKAIAGRSVEMLYEGSQNTELPIAEQRVLAHAYAKQALIDSGQIISTRLISNLALGDIDLANNYIGTIPSNDDFEGGQVQGINFDNSADVARLNRIMDAAIANMDRGETLLDSLRTEVHSFYGNTPIEEQGSLRNYRASQLEAMLEMSIAGDTKLGNLLVAADTVMNKDHSVSTSVDDMGRLKDAIKENGGVVNSGGSGWTFDTRDEELKALDVFRLRKTPEGGLALPSISHGDRVAYYEAAEQGLRPFSESVRGMSEHQIFKQEEAYVMRMGAALAPLLGQPDGRAQKIEAVKGFLRHRYHNSVSDQMAADFVDALSPDSQSQDNLPRLLGRTSAAITRDALEKQSTHMRKGIKVTGGLQDVNLQLKDDPLRTLNPIFVRDILDITSVDTGEVSPQDIDSMILAPKGMELTYIVDGVPVRAHDLSKDAVVEGFGVVPRLEGPDDGNQVIAAGSNDPDPFQPPQSLVISSQWSKRIKEYFNEEGVAERAHFEEVFEDGEGAAVHEAWTRLMMDISDGNVSVIRDMEKINLDTPDRANYYDQLRVYLFAGRGWNSTLRDSRGNLQLAHISLAHALLRSGKLPHEMIRKGFRRRGVDSTAQPTGMQALFRNPEKAIRRDDDGKLMFVFGDQNQMDSGIDVPYVWDMGSGFVQDVNTSGHIRVPVYDPRPVWYKPPE